MTDLTPNERAARRAPDIARKFDALFPRQPALGVWVDIPSIMTAEIVASVGCDFLLIDLEHSPTSEETAIGQTLAAERYGARPIIRVAEATDPWIKKALDIGAVGLMAPSVPDAETAARIVAATRYGPQGRRGVSSAVRAAGFGGDPDYQSRWNDVAFLIAQIESPSAAANAASIAATPGVDALFFGPADYAAAAGYPGGAAVREALVETFAAAHAAGRLAGSTPFEGVSAQDLIELGADIVMVAGDIAALRSGVEQSLKESLAAAGRA